MTIIDRIALSEQDQTLFSFKFVSGGDLDHVIDAYGVGINPPTAYMRCCNAEELTPGEVRVIVEDYIQLQNQLNKIKQNINNLLH